MKEVKILSKDEYLPSTVTMVANLNQSINVLNIAKYLPVVHLYNKNTGKRITLVSGSRESIKYYGYEGIVVSVCYKKIRRGMRTGAMNNMVSIDLQYGKKNIHVKLSSTTITSVGTPGFEFGLKVFDLMISHINMLNDNIKYAKKLDKKIIKDNLDWVFKNCVIEEKNELKSLSVMLKLAKMNKDNLDLKFVKSCLVYLDDFEKNGFQKYREKIFSFLEETSFYEEKLVFLRSTIYNSVFHINLTSKNVRIPLHKLAPYLADIGFVVEFHNWVSEGVNICFDIEEKKIGVQHNNKEYKHRFTIHERGTMRQCSPTFKEESYKYYLGVAKQIQKFMEEKIEEVDYTKYIEKELIPVI